MATVTLNISPATVTNIGGYSNPTSTALSNVFTLINNLENGFNQDFSNYFFGLETGSYGFSGSTQLSLNTNSASYTFNGPTLQSQFNVAEQNHAGSVNLSSVTLYNKINGDTINIIGNLVLTGSSTYWYLSGNVTEEKLSTPSSSTVIAGTAQTVDLIGSITYVDGLATSANITSETLTTNGFIAKQVVTGNLNLTVSGSSIAVGGTVTGQSQTYANGDYINVANLSLPVSTSFSLAALPNGGDTVTGTYQGGTVNGGTGNDTIAAGNGVTSINGGGGTDTVTFKAAPSSYTFSEQLNGSWVISSSASGEGPDTLTGITYAKFSDGSSLNLVTGQWSGGGVITVTAPVETTGALSAHADIAVLDSAANVTAALDPLAILAAAGKITSISLTDSGTPILSIPAAQFTADAAALNLIDGSYSVTVAAGTSAVSITGLTGHATTVQFSADASQYNIGAANGAVTITDGGVTDTLSNIAAIQFADVTEIVAAPPGPASAVTTGNVTELYAAVLAREPDLGGLTFYQTFLKNNPNTPLQQFAEFFLNSTEYTSAHSYAQSTVGDEQFITDSYTNLLHRTPSASEVSFYETNVLAPAVANLTPGTTAYASAALQAHALMLVYFSASAEFLSDVQVTAANPPSAQHWLVLT